MDKLIFNRAVSCVEISKYQVSEEVNGIFDCGVFFYVPNFKERGILVSGCASIRLPRTMHARVLKFHRWIPNGKIADTHFVSCPSYLPFWSYAPLKKIRRKSDACHIL